MTAAHYLIIALVLGIAGMAGLYSSWKRYLAIPGLAAAGWVLLLLSGWFWIESFGAEFGTAFALLFIPAAAWVFVLLNAEIRRRKPREQRTEQPIKPATHTLIQHIVLFIIAVPLAAVTTTYISVALATSLPWNQLNQLVLAVFMMPVLWGCAVYWACADPKLLRPALSLTVGGLACAALLHV